MRKVSASVDKAKIAAAISVCRLSFDLCNVLFCDEQMVHEAQQKQAEEQKAHDVKGLLEENAGIVYMGLDYIIHHPDCWRQCPLHRSSS